MVRRSMIESGSSGGQRGGPRRSRAASSLRVAACLGLAGLVGCFSLDGGGGCDIGTNGELGNLDFVFDYGDDIFPPSMDAKSGRVWAVGAHVDVRLRSPGGSDDVLAGAELRSSAPEVLAFESGSGIGDARVRFLAPGTARIEVWSEGALYDYLTLAVARVTSVLSVVGLPEGPAGLVRDGLGEPGLVLRRDTQAVLLFGLASATFQRLDGVLPLTVAAGDAGVVELGAAAAAFSGSYPVVTLELRAVTPGATELVLRQGELEDRFPLQVVADPQPASLQLSLYRPGYSAQYPVPLHEALHLEDASNALLLVPWAYDAQGWPIVGLRYAFAGPLDLCELRASSTGAWAELWPRGTGTGTLGARTLDSPQPLRAERRVEVLP